MVQLEKRCSRTKSNQQLNKVRVRAWRTRNRTKQSRQNILEYNRKEVARVQAYRLRKKNAMAELANAKWRMLKQKAVRELQEKEKAVRARNQAVKAHEKLVIRREIELKQREAEFKQREAEFKEREGVFRRM